MTSFILKCAAAASLIVASISAGSALAATGTGGYAATVGSSGTMIRNTRATSSSKSSTGRYSVVFPDVISQCSWSATVGGTGTVAPSPAFAVAHRSSASTSTIEVRVWAVNNQAVHVQADAPFHLIVVCD